MAKLILSDIISDIRGTVGTHTYSYWKGVHLVKNRSVNYRTAHESAFRTAQKDFIARVSQYWMGGLTQDQRDGWQTYAEYIETLGDPYYGPTVIKLVGWRQYGGIMSGFNAFVLTNMLRRSIGKTDILEDDPIAIDPPPMPVFSSLTFLPGPPKLLRIILNKPDALIEDTWFRVFCRGHRYAHLILAKTGVAIPDAPIAWDVTYDCIKKPLAATPPWSTFAYTGDFCTALGTEIEIDTVPEAAGAQCSYYLDVAGFDNAVGWTVEAHLKVIEVLTGTFVLIVYDGTRWFRLSFTETGIEAFTGDTHEMDTTSHFRVYRITGKGTAMKVYVDGVLAITSTIVGQATGDKRVAFGDTSNAPNWNSNVQWSFIRIFDAGAVAGATETIDIEYMRFAKGHELPLQNELHDVQLDYISENGRYSPPSYIRSMAVRDPFLGGLWGSYPWDALVWDG